MAHELSSNKNGQIEMMYVGEKPWHGLGQALDHPATAEEAIKAANLGWTVSIRDMITTCGTDVEDYKAIVRDDNNKVLSVMSKWYTPIQNAEAFAFMDSVVGTGGAYYETAGSVFEGRKIFLCMKLPNVIRATSEDMVEEYLTLVNSHDGSLALKMYFTPIRVVCNNTLQASLRRHSESISIRHLGDVNSKIKAAQDGLRLAHRYFSDFQDIVTRLVKSVADSVMVDQFLNHVFEVKPDEKISKSKEDAMSRVRANFLSNPKNNLNGIGGSAWSLYNAATEYADHECVSVSKDADRRMSSILFGSSAHLKQRAMDAIMSLTA